MIPFDGLYGWSCNPPINWCDLVNMVHIGLDMSTNMENEMQVIKKDLKETHDRQKSYSEKHMEFKEF